MFTAQAFLFFIALLLCAILAEPVCKKLKIPYPIILVVIGFAGSEITTGILGIDTGIRWHNFDTIIFHGLIPVLIFQAALTLNVGSFRKNIIPIGFMAFPVMLCATVLTAAFIYLAIDHPTGFPWIAALLAGSLLSATDPAAVLAVLKQAGTPEHIQSILEGESLFNDAMAIVLFMVLISMALDPGINSSWQQVVRQFSLVFAGGVLIGLCVAIAAHLVLAITGNNQVAVTIVTLLTAYGSFILAEDLYHVSGVMAVLTAGLTMRYRDFRHGQNEKVAETRYFWHVITHICESMIFLLAGVTITVAMFAEQWLAILYGVIAVLITRFILVFPTLGILGRLPGTRLMTVREQFLVGWGGVRGTVTLALALSLPLTLDYYYTIQSIAYGVVLFSLFFQATTIGIFVRK